MIGNLKIAIVLIAWIYKISAAEQHVQESFNWTNNKNFENFNNVIEYIDNEDVQLQPSLIIQFYNVMSVLQHTDDPLRAIPLYKEVLKFFKKPAPTDLKKKLNEIIFSLRWDSIVPKSATLLEAAVKPVADKLVDLLDHPDLSIAEMTFSVLWQKVIVRFPNPIEKVARTCSKVKHNVYLLLTLYKMHKIQYKYNEYLIKELKRLQLDTEYQLTVSKERQIEVHEIIGTQSNRNIVYSRKNSVSLYYKYVKFLYKGNFQNYEKVLAYVEKQKGFQNKASLIVEFFNIMNGLKHLDDPLRTIPFYKEVLNYFKESLPVDLTRKLQEIIDTLVWDIIVPKVANMLEAAVNPRASTLIELLKNSPRSLTQKVISALWLKVLSKYPNASVELTETSADVKQNIILFWKLYKMRKIRNKDFIKALKRMKLDIFGRKTNNSLVAPLNCPKITPPICPPPTCPQLICPSTSCLLDKEPDTSPKTPPSERKARAQIAASDLEIYNNVQKIYDGNFANFNEVIRYMDDTNGVMDKANIIIALHEIMNKLNHTADSLKAASLDEAVEERINTKPHHLSPRTLDALNDLRKNLLLKAEKTVT